MEKSKASFEIETEIVSIYSRLILSYIANEKGLQFPFYNLKFDDFSIGISFARWLSQFVAKYIWNFK